MHVELDVVPLRDSTLTPEEILMSESQERMCAVVTPDNVDAVLAICDKWGVQATVIGEVTDGETLVITWRGETIVDVPPRTVAHDGPVYNRPYARPDTQDVLESQTSAHLPRPSDGVALKGDLLALLATANVGDKSWVTDQYDRYVRGNTVLAQPDDAGVIRVDEATGRGVALSLDGNGRFARLDPYNGAKLALAEAYRNVAVSGAIPIAVTNCLNFGSPEDPGVMWQFEQAVTGLADGALELGTPVTGGNVSFYNQTGDTAILPTPVIGVLGVIDDVERRTPLRYKDDGELIYLLGDTRDELDGSAWAGELHAHLGGRPPLVDLKHEKVLAEILVAASRDGMASAAHDVSDGGVGIALVEMALRSNIGLRFWAPDNLDPFTFLFSESAGRALVVIARSEEVRFTEMCAARQVVANRIGVVDSGLATEHGFATGTQVVEMTGQFAVPLDELRAAHVSALPQVVA